MATVLTFGSFDPLHEGHKQLLRQAKALGDWLIVVIAHDTAIQAQKGYIPHQPAEERQKAVSELPDVDQALIGQPVPHNYELLEELNFDILALGYDQQPDDKTVRQLLDDHGKSAVTIIRLESFQPDTYKSSYFRKK